MKSPENLIIDIQFDVKCIIRIVLMNFSKNYHFGVPTYFQKIECIPLNLPVTVLHLNTNDNSEFILSFFIELILGKLAFAIFLVFLREN